MATKNTDIAHKMTDAELEKLEKRIASVYEQAAKEMQGKVDAYFKQFEDRDKKQKQLLEAGKITQTQYDQWRLAQIGRGERFEDMRDKLAERYTKANEVVAAYINDTTPSIYSLNRNYAAYTIEKVAGDVGFTLWDEQTVKRLLVEQPDLMPYYPPERAVKRGIDLEWGKSQITKQVTSGILQGESIPQMADKLQQNISKMERDSAIRAARTAVTGAQNAGRIDSYDAAKKMGIDVKKEWLATLDNRTRHEHAKLDGQVVENDEPFEVDGYELMFPGDPDGAPEMIYNCRCTVIASLPDVDTSDAQRRAIDPKTGESVLIEDMTYAEWAGWKEEKAERIFVGAKTIEEAQEFAQKYCQSEFMAKTFKGVADYKGISVETANEINKALDKVYGEIDLDKISGIKVVSPNSAIGKKAFKDGADAVFAYDPIQHGIYVNKDIIKNEKTFAEYVKRSEDSWITVMENIDKLSGSQKELALTYKNAGRSLVNGKTVEGMFTHELGHHAEWTLLDTATNNAAGKNMSKYAPKISGYANASKGEYLAESFAAYMQGEADLIDPELKKAFDKHRKKK